MNKKTDGDHGWTPLHCAAYYNKHQLIKWLLKNKADVNATGKNGYRVDEYGRSDAESKRLIREYRNK